MSPFVIPREAKYFIARSQIQSFLVFSSDNGINSAGNCTSSVSVLSSPKSAYLTYERAFSIADSGAPTALRSAATVLPLKSPQVQQFQTLLLPVLCSVKSTSNLLFCVSAFGAVVGVDCCLMLACPRLMPDQQVF